MSSYVISPDDGGWAQGGGRESACTLGLFCALKRLSRQSWPLLSKVTQPETGETDVNKEPANEPSMCDEYYHLRRCDCCVFGIDIILKGHLKVL